MKINEIKHNHTLTDLLKVLLFSILMLLPFIDVFVRCGYVMFNKNAYQSYYGETINEKIETQIQYNNLQDNEMYLFSNEITPNDNITDVGYMFVTDVVNINGFNNNADLSNVGKIRFYKTNNYNTLQFWDTNETIDYAQITLSQNIAQFTFRFKGYTPNYTGFQYANYFYSVSYNKYSYLDNVFEYSVSQLENSQLYNWTTQTAIYSGVSQMTTQLGITTNIIPIIVVYWFFITIIYIILDIVIRLFTILTHFIGSKTSS